MKNFVDKAFLNNRWLWFHILAGGMVARGFNLLVDSTLSLAFVLAGAVIWEIYEGLTTDIEKVYGSEENFIFDAIGDVVGAVVMALLVVR